MEDQLLELKTCIAVYQKKYAEIVNLNIGLESKLHYLSEKIATLEKELEEKNVKLFGNDREKELIRSQENMNSRHVEILNKISSIEKQSARLMKLDERMHDLEGQSASMVNASKDLIEMKEEIKNKISTPVPKKRVSKKKDITPNYEESVVLDSNITEETMLSKDCGEF
jgi:chromosome segregation ATPase